MKLIYLHGPLAKTFGAGPYKFKANNLRQVLGGMTMIHPTFYRELIKFDDLCVMKIKGDKKVCLTEQELGFNFGNYDEIHLGVGVRGEVAEGAYAAATYFFAEGTAAYYFAYAVAYVAITAAISYGISAIIQSLADVPTTEAERAKNESNLFSGPENRTPQGGRAQLCYGMFQVGSYTMSQSIEARRQAIGLTDSLSVYVGATGSLNLFANDPGTIAPSVTSFIIDGVTTAAGGTYTGVGFTVSVAANGDLVYTPTVEGTTSVTVNATDTLTPLFTQTIALTSTIEYNYAESGGGGSGDGDSGSGGDGGAGDGASGVGGSAGSGEGDGGVGGDGTGTG